METEVTSTTNEQSNNLKNNANFVQSIIKEFSSIENTELQNNESSSEASSNEIKIINNKSGASPKMSEQYTANSSHEEIGKQNCDDNSAPGDCQYFFEDEIFRIDKKGRVKFGLVLETPGTYSGDEDDEFDETLDKGEIRVVWCPEFKESVQSENSVSGSYLYYVHMYIFFLFPLGIDIQLCNCISVVQG